jgi:hypothetical protein
MTNKLAAKRGFVGRVAVWLLLTLGAVLLALVVMGSNPQPTQASCAAAPEEGDWVNADLNTRQVYITRIEVRQSCPGWRVHVWTVCKAGPSDPCRLDWGWKAASRLNSGEIYTKYIHRQSFGSDDHIFARMSGNRPGLLWVNMQRDYIDPNRTDYSTHDWFRCVSACRP